MSAVSMLLALVACSGGGSVAGPGAPISVTPPPYPLPGCAPTTANGMRAVFPCEAHPFMHGVFRVV